MNWADTEMTLQTNQSINNRSVSHNKKTNAIISKKLSWQEWEKETIV